MDYTTIFWVLFLYFVPTIVGAYRGHKQVLAIFVLNFFLGWTGVGWVIALVWSCTKDVKEKKKENK